MKESIYNYIVEKNNNYLIYNGLNATCVILNEKEYINFKNYSSTISENKEYLRLGLYVDDNYNEVDAVFYSSRLLTDKDQRQFYRIYTTLRCNAKCPYCYEQGAQLIDMDIDMANSICDFIEERMIDKNSLIIEWFGGEPLLNEKIITYISNKLRPLCEKRKIGFYSRMVSNGLLFDKRTLSKALEYWNLTQIQITIDGMKNTYEGIKCFSIPNAFERVIDNIENALESGIQVSIRLNYDISSIEEILCLIDFWEKNLKNMIILMSTVEEL